MGYCHRISNTIIRLTESQLASRAAEAGTGAEEEAGEFVRVALVECGSEEEEVAAIEANTYPALAAVERSAQWQELQAS